jgi:hypothetical protein
MAAATLVLRDIHRPEAPAWWPPAPGWWILALVLLLLAFAALWWRRRRQRRERLLQALFDDALAAASTPPARVAAMSELLRRAARRRDGDADRLEGESWLAFLDAGAKEAPFTRGAGRLLLEGGYRREVPPHEVAALERVARARFLDWMRRR